MLIIRLFLHYNIRKVIKYKKNQFIYFSEIILEIVCICSCISFKYSLFLAFKVYNFSLILLVVSSEKFWFSPLRVCERLEISLRHSLSS